MSCCTVCVTLDRVCVVLYCLCSAGPGLCRAVLFVLRWTGSMSCCTVCVPLDRVYVVSCVVFLCGKYFLGFFSLSVG